MEFSEGVTVQHFVFRFATDDYTRTVAITGVNTSTSFIILTSNTSGTLSNADERGTYSAKFNPGTGGISTSTLVERSEIGTGLDVGRVSMQVVTMPSSTVAVVSSTIAGNVVSSSVAITAVNTSSTFIIPHVMSGNVGGVEGLFETRSFFSNIVDSTSTSIEFVKQTTSTGAGTHITAYIVSVPSAFVQAGQQKWSPTEVTTTTPITVASGSVPFLSRMGGSSAGIGNGVPKEKLTPRSLLQA